MTDTTPPLTPTDSQSPEENKDASVLFIASSKELQTPERLQELLKPYGTVLDTCLILFLIFIYLSTINTCRYQK